MDPREHLEEKYVSFQIVPPHLKYQDLGFFVALFIPLAQLTLNCQNNNGVSPKNLCLVLSQL